MAPQKARDTAFLKLEIRRQHAIKGLARSRVKHKFGMPEKTTDKDKSGSRIDDEVQSETEGEGSNSDSGSELEDDEVIDAENNSGRSFSSIAKRCAKFIEDNMDPEDLGQVGENPADASTLPRRV